MGIEPPLIVNGVPQIPIAGASFARTLTERSAPGGKKTQYFEVMGSRAIYHDGWMASTFGPRVRGCPDCRRASETGHPTIDRWELYHLDEDWSQAHDLADEMPEKLAQMRELFAIEAARNQVLPDRRRFVGARLPPGIAHHAAVSRVGVSPAKSPASPSSARRRWETRTTPSPSRPICPPMRAGSSMRSAASPAGSLVTSTTGTCATSTTCSSCRAPRFAPPPNCSPGRRRLSWRPRYAEQRPGGPLDVSVRVGSEVVATGRVPISAPLLFTANDCFDIGVCLGSPVSDDYYDKAPFRFDGQIDRVHVAYT